MAGCFIAYSLVGGVSNVSTTVAAGNAGNSFKLLEDRFKLPPTVAAQSVEALTTPGFGMTADARFNLEGFRNVLSMRAEMEGQWGGVAPDPAKYLDLSYYDRALRAAGK